MIPQFVTVIIILLFVILVVAKVAVDVISLFINGFIIYVLGLRSFNEVKQGQYHLYTICGLLSLFLLLLFGNFLGFLWSFTTFLILTCLFVWIVQQIKEKYKL